MCPLRLHVINYRVLGSASLFFPRSELEKGALLKFLQGKPLWTKGRAPAALSPTERGLELMKRSLTDAYSTTGK